VTGVQTCALPIFQRAHICKVSMLFVLCEYHKALTVHFYDSDFNPQMDRQCEDRLGLFLSCEGPC
jgi:hypothetical protein